MTRSLRPIFIFPPRPSRLQSYWSPVSLRCPNEREGRVRSSWNIYSAIARTACAAEAGPGNKLAPLLKRHAEIIGRDWPRSHARRATEATSASVRPSVARCVSSSSLFCAPETTAEFIVWASSSSFSHSKSPVTRRFTGLLVVPHVRGWYPGRCHETGKGLTPGGCRHLYALASSEMKDMEEQEDTERMEDFIMRLWYL